MKVRITDTEVAGQGFYWQDGDVVEVAPAAGRRMIERGQAVVEVEIFRGQRARRSAPGASHEGSKP